MFNWIKPEVIIAAFFGFLGVGGSLALIWSNGLTHTALNDDRMITLTADVKAIRDSIMTMPLQAQRLTQLEAWQGEQKGFNGAVDSRISTMKEDLARATTDIANIKSASGSKMR